jgi:hypothetical protein
MINKFNKERRRSLAAFNERNRYTIQQQEPVAKEPRRTQNKHRTGHKKSQHLKRMTSMASFLTREFIYIYTVYKNRIKKTWTKEI